MGWGGDRGLRWEGDIGMGWGGMEVWGQERIEVWVGERIDFPLNERFTLHPVRGWGGGGDGGGGDRLPFLNGDGRSGGGVGGRIVVGVLAWGWEKKLPTLSGRFALN